MKDNNSENPLENPESEYIGNIWGWKFSFISLGIIVAMLLIMLLRYAYLNNNPPSLEKQPVSVEKDSTHVEAPVD